MEQVWLDSLFWIVWTIHVSFSVLRRLMDVNPTNITQTQQTNLVNQLKRRATFVKYKSTGRSYSRLYYLVLSEDAIEYYGSRHKQRRQACLIKDMEQIRPGLSTSVWRKCLQRKKITANQEKLAFSIMYNNNRQSLDLLAETEESRSRWIQGLEFLISRYRSHMRTHQEITDQWVWNLFNRADVDHSGHLSRQEVRRLLYTLNIQLEDTQIDRYFTEANVRTSNYDELAHLDKEEFLVFFKYVSQRPELLKIICQWVERRVLAFTDHHQWRSILSRFNGSNNEQMAATLSEYTMIHRLTQTSPIGQTRNGPSLSFRKKPLKKNSSLTSSFRRRSASITPENTSTTHAVEKRNYLTIEQLKDFLHNEQQIKALSIEDCSRLIARFEPSVEGRQCEEMGVDGLRLLLLHDEFCLMNAEKSNRVYHDMTRPITDYFIATSHNT